VRESAPALGKYISRVHAAEKLDCSAQLLDRLIREGRLPVRRLGRKVLINEQELNRLLEAGELK
jgi:excisionase family DNA binding protein